MAMALSGNENRVKAAELNLRGARCMKCAILVAVCLIAARPTDATQRNRTRISSGDGF